MHISLGDVFMLCRQQLAARAEEALSDAVELRTLLLGTVVLQYAWIKSE